LNILKQKKTRNILMRVCLLPFGLLSLDLFWQLTREWCVLWKGAFYKIPGLACRPTIPWACTRSIFFLIFRVKNMIKTDEIWTKSSLLRRRCKWPRPQLTSAHIHYTFDFPAINQSQSSTWNWKIGRQWPSHAWTIINKSVVFLNLKVLINTAHQKKAFQSIINDKKVFS
jgi:hypothetical protein